jgi:hypothetical protein
MQKGIDNKDDNDDEDVKAQKSAMERFASGLDEENREREAAKMMETEMNITEFTVEPEMEKVLTDFYVKPYPDVSFVAAG